MLVTRCVECNHEELSVNSGCLCACHVRVESARTPAERIAELEAELAELKREAACPCCRGGFNIQGEPCQECHGKGLAIIAYESARVHSKLLANDKAELEERLAMVTEVLREALVWHIPDTQTIIRLQPGGKEVCKVVRHGTRVKAEKALKATAPTVAAYLARVEARGAARELRRISEASIHTIRLSPDMFSPGQDYRLVLCEALEGRAAELEGA